MVTGSFLWMGILGILHTHYVWEIHRGTLQIGLWKAGCKYLILVVMLRRLLMFSLYTTWTSIFFLSFYIYVLYRWDGSNVLQNTSAVISSRNLQLAAFLTQAFSTKWLNHLKCKQSLIKETDTLCNLSYVLYVFLSYFP